MDTQREIVFSAVQPTGTLTIGNYAGAIRNWLKLYDEYECYFAVADLHSLTVDNVPAQLRQNVYGVLATYLAFGVDPNKCVLFVQSHVSAHAELAWVLNCCTQYGEAARMTQFKDKSRRGKTVNLGLLCYPTLMAADILLYKAKHVPVGVDQKQHVEIARVIAERFNSRYSPTFEIPNVMMPKYGSKIMSLAEPSIKMSKSDENPNAYILVTDSPDVVKRKISRAVTDSESVVRRSPDKAGISNLLTIYQTFASVDAKTAENEFVNCDYAAFKARVADAVIEKLSTVQAEYNRLLLSKDYLSSVMKAGAERAEAQARKMLYKVYKKVGLTV